MAVVDKYTDADIQAGKKGAPFKTAAGARPGTMIATVAVAAGDDDTSKYRLFADVPATYIPLEIQIHNTAITNGTDYDLGLYAINGGAVVEVDILADGISMASARTIATSNNAGMTSIVLGDIKTLAQLSGQTKPDASYDIVLTANTVGTVDGTIRATATFAYAS